MKWKHILKVVESLKGFCTGNPINWGKRAGWKNSESSGFYGPLHWHCLTIGYSELPHPNDFRNLAESVSILDWLNFFVLSAHKFYSFKFATKGEKLKKIRKKSWMKRKTRNKVFVVELNQSFPIKSGNKENSRRKIAVQ